MNIIKTITLLLSFSIHFFANAQDSMYNVYKQKALQHLKAGENKKAIEVYNKAFAVLDGKGYRDDRYNAACAWSLMGNADSAYHHLFIIAYKSGYSDYIHMSIDTDLDSIRDDKRWDILIKKVKENDAKKEEWESRVLVAELDSILITDQKYRRHVEMVEKKYGRDSDEMNRLWKTINYWDSVNLVKVKDILEEHGWPGPDEVGYRRSNAIFLTIQHSDIETQNKYLPVMREAVKNKKASGSSLALLEDRVALRNGGKQIYGSQIGRDGDGKYYVLPLKDPEHVDERRAKVGLEPLNDYTQYWNFNWDVAAHNKRMQEAENKKD